MTFWVKESWNGWDKRQSSLVLCIFVDGLNCIPPIIMFHGKSIVLSKELSKYNTGVIVKFNKTVHMNDKLFLKYIELYLIPAFGDRPGLFAIELCSSHKTLTVLKSLRQHNIISILIPAGCMSLVQPFDLSCNNQIKSSIPDLIDEAILACESVQDIKK